MAYALRSDADKRTGLTSTEVVVLGRIVSRADTDGYCWPSLLSLASETGKSISTILRAIKGLETKRCIIVESGRDLRTSNRYWYVPTDLKLLKRPERRQPPHPLTREGWNWDQHMTERAALRRQACRVSGRNLNQSKVAEMEPQGSNNDTLGFHNCNPHLGKNDEVISKEPSNGNNQYTPSESDYVTLISPKGATTDLSEDLPQGGAEIIPFRFGKSDDKPKRVRKRHGYTAAFEVWWKAFERPVDKPDTFRNYRAALEKGVSEEVLLAAAKSYAAKQRGGDPHFHLHPKRWLDKERWTLENGPASDERTALERAKQRSLAAALGY